MNLLKTVASKKLLILSSLAFLSLSLAIGFAVYRIQILTNQLNNLSDKQNQADSVYSDLLFDDHLRISEQLKLQADIDAQTLQLEELLKIKENAEYLKIQDAYKKYADVSSKLKRNTDVKLNTTSYSETISKWGELLLTKDFDTLNTQIDATLVSLDKEYKDYLATLPPPPTAVGEGYSYTTVSTERGNFGVYLIKAPLSSVRVVTASASEGDCEDGCATKPLAQHVKDNGGYAGMNGSYFCPPDYASCSGKVNSSDYAFYKTSSGKWLNKHALSWGDTGLATFNGNSARFYKKSSDYGNSGVTAGISNYPTLVDGGNVVVDSGKLTSFQNVKGLRGAIGVGKSNLYLAIVSSASVLDAAYVMKALGAEDALNLDGGGSSAMYINGSYIVGPGRSLPNAIILTK